MAIARARASASRGCVATPRTSRARARARESVARAFQRVEGDKRVEVRKSAAPRTRETARARANARVEAKGGRNDSFPDVPGLPDAEALMAKYAGDAARGAARAAKGALRGAGPSRRTAAYDGVFALLFINFALFACDHWAHMAFVKTLYLNHAKPTWWQFATSTFCHANWAHLSSNIFFLYIFGKLVEEEEGAFGVWMSYLVTGIGANVASWLLLPKSVGGVLGIGGAATVSLGASGAVFGLFAVSVLVKLSWNWRRLLEVVILGQFVVDRFLSEAKMVAAAGSGVGAGNVNHVAHLGGAFAGVLLIFFLTRMVPP